MLGRTEAGFRGLNPAYCAAIMPAAVVTPVATRNAPTVETPQSAEDEFAQARDRIIKFISEHLGARGEILNRRIENAHDAATLEHLAYEARRTLFEFAGRAVAEKFTREML